MKSSAIISILILLIINKTIESASVHRRNGGGGGGGIKNNSTMKPFRWILDKPQCLERQRMAQVDLYIERMIGFGRRGRPFPENGAQLKPYCK
mgnify:CR=1 FL=1